MQPIACEDMEKRISYWCPYGHEHKSLEDCQPCVDKFDLECEWHDETDPFFLALPGKGNGA